MSSEGRRIIKCGYSFFQKFRPICERSVYQLAMLAPFWVRSVSDAGSFLGSLIFSHSHSLDVESQNACRKSARLPNSPLAALNEQPSTPTVSVKNDTSVTECRSGLLKEYSKTSYETSILPFRETNRCKDNALYK